MSKIKSFKYAGTPEQMQKVADWCTAQGIPEYIVEEEYEEDDYKPDGIVVSDGGYVTEWLWIDFYESANEPPMPPEYELAIFGSTRGITGRKENPWIENTGKMPVKADVLVDVECRDQQPYGGAKAGVFWWDRGGLDSDIIRWRYAEKSDAEYFVAPETPSKHEQDLETFKQVAAEFKENFATFEDGSALRKNSDGNFEVKAGENSEWRLTNGSSVTFSGAAAKWESVLNEEINVNDYEKPVRNKYMREIKPNVWVDVYDVIRAFAVTDGALQHLLKKALAVGQRGHKDAAEDYSDILASAKRAKEMHEEWNK